VGRKVEYQGYTVESTPIHDTAWGKWRLHILISVETSQGIQTREFSSHVLYSTEQEGALNCTRKRGVARSYQPGQA